MKLFALIDLMKAKVTSIYMAEEPKLAEAAHHLHVELEGLEDAVKSEFSRKLESMEDKIDMLLAHCCGSCACESTDETQMTEPAVMSTPEAAPQDPQPTAQEASAPGPSTDAVPAAAQEDSSIMNAPATDAASQAASASAPSTPSPSQDQSAPAPAPQNAAPATDSATASPALATSPQDASAADHPNQASSTDAPTPPAQQPSQPAESAATPSSTAPAQDGAAAQEPSATAAPEQSPTPSATASSAPSAAPSTSDAQPTPSTPVS